MELFSWNLKAHSVLTRGPIIPVVTIHNANDTVALAQALWEGGMRSIEITLRTEAALGAITKVREAIPEMLVGAGTIISPKNLQDAATAGAQFALSPGCTRNLLLAGINGSIPFIPGVSTLSEVLQGLEFGYTHFKFFPAAACGGTAVLQAISGPLPQVKFCPTGGINGENVLDYLALSNVECVGGSWFVPAQAIVDKNWPLITDLSQDVLNQVNSLNSK